MNTPPIPAPIMATFFFAVSVLAAALSICVARDYAKLISKITHENHRLDHTRAVFVSGRQTGRTAGFSPFRVTLLPANSSAASEGRLGPQVSGSRFQSAGGFAIALPAPRLRPLTLTPSRSVSI
jgi:hypothetical protein